MKKPKPTPPRSQNGSQPVLFQAPNGEPVRVCFDEPEVTSDAGLLLLMQHPDVQREIGFLADCLSDERKRPQHSLAEMLTQRVFQILGGYQDGNDSDQLRHDPVMKMATGRHADAPALASQPTICRLENLPTQKDLLRIFYAQIDAFARTYKKAPDALVLDIDPSAHLTYGDQQLTLYNHHVGDYCLMPFYVYEGQSGLPIASVIRPGKTPTAGEIKALLKRLVKRLRHHFPQTRIIFRADSHHTKPAIMDWCEEHQIDFIIGLGPNVKINELFTPTAQKAREKYERNCRKGNPDQTACSYASGWYQAGSWSRPRRVICRVYHGPRGTDMRYVVTSFQEASAQYLYQTVYSGRGAAVF